jgi:hypothetical protein
MMNRLTIYPLIATLILTMLLIAACNSPETDAPAEPTSAPASQQSEALPVDTAGPTSTVEAKQADESVASTAAESEQASEAGAEPEPTEAPFFFNLLAYEVPRMNEVVVENVAYGLHEGAPLTMDIYYPPDVAADAQLPVVVYVMGYRDDSSAIGGPLKDIGAYDSWGRLTAASGMVGVAYQTYQPEDLEAPTRPTLRWTQTLLVFGHRQPILRPRYLLPCKKRKII